VMDDFPADYLSQMRLEIRTEKGAVLPTSVFTLVWNNKSLDRLSRKISLD